MSSRDSLLLICTDAFRLPGDCIQIRHTINNGDIHDVYKQGKQLMEMKLKLIQCKCRRNDRKDSRELVTPPTPYIQSHRKSSYAYASTHSLLRRQRYSSDSLPLIGRASTINHCNLLNLHIPHQSHLLIYFLCQFIPPFLVEITIK
jgi:hypothetical protein